MRNLLLLRGSRPLILEKRLAITSIRHRSSFSSLIPNKKNSESVLTLNSQQRTVATCSILNNASPLLYPRFHSTVASTIDVEEDDKDEEFPLFLDLSELDVFFKDRLNHNMQLKQMTEIQAKTWSPILKKKDVLARARTGTGKTLAFLLPSMQCLLDNKPEPDKVGMLILSPTRELAMQIAQQVRSLSGRHKNMTHQLLLGGSPKYEDIRKLQQRVPDILIATPGRIQDHLKSTVLTTGNNKTRVPFPQILSSVKTLVLDETDRLLDMGFKREVEAITRHTPRNKQTLLFSATLPKDVLAVLRATLKPDFETVDCIQEDDSASHTNAHVQQSHVVLPTLSSSMLPYRSVTAFVQIMQELVEKNPSNHKIMCFFPTTNLVRFYSNLFNFGLGRPVLEIHSKKTQSYRTSASSRFREASSSILFTSDVSARGVDYPGVTHVVQVGMPETRQAYIHRLGRTGRATQKSGEGILILHPLEKAFLTRHLGDMEVPRNHPLQTLLDESTNHVSVMDRLEPIIASIRRGSNRALTQDAQDAYRSMLGFYSGRLPTVGVTSKKHLVDMVNGFAMEVGLPEMPSINYKTAVNAGLKNIRGINVEQQDSSRWRGSSNSKPQSYGKRGSRSSGKSQRKSGGGSLTGRGSYGDWGRSLSTSSK